MYTIDTSVWLDAFDPSRPQHKASRALMEHLDILQLPIYLPNLILAEVASAVARSRNDAMQGRLFADRVRELPYVHLVPLDDALAERTAEIAADYRLRAADALYIAVALHTNSSLVSLDNEQRTRVASLLNTHMPEQALATLPN